MTRQINVGGVLIGGGAPVVIQSMLNTKTTDVEGSLVQIRQLKDAGCQIARLAVPNMEGARGFAEICKESPLPLVADIHFDYKLAIAAAEGGAAKIRINPGNIGGEDRVKAVVDVCKDRKIPIRIGVNGGSLDKRLLEKYGHPTAEALVESAFEHLELLEKFGFYDTCVSMKSSTVPTMVAACRLFREKCDYPLHIGVTETGPVKMGLMKSAMGIGALLLDGIGDTIRVSLTDDPVEEVYAAGSVLIDPAIGEAGDVDTAIITLKMENGAIAVIDNSRRAAYGYDQRAEVFGSKGMVATANDTLSTAVVSNADGVTGEKPLYFFLERYMQSFATEVKGFINAIENDTGTLVGVEDGLKPVLMGIAAKKSVEEHRPVKLSEIEY